MKKPAIPLDGQDGINRAVRETLEIVTGRRRAARIEALPQGADLAQVTAKLNELLRLLQGD